MVASLLAQMCSKCVCCCLLAKFVATHVVYSVSNKLRCSLSKMFIVLHSFLHARKNADMLYSRLDLLLLYVCHEAFHFEPILGPSLATVLVVLSLVYGLRVQGISNQNVFLHSSCATALEETSCHALSLLHIPNLAFRSLL